MSAIKNFYKNEHVLITGGIGFVGKLLISKIFLSCPQIKKITLLIRKKGSDSVYDQVQNVFKDEIFDTLKKQVPTFYEKVDLLEGDCEQRHLGLSQMDRFLITQSITIVFHCATNVKFNNHLKAAIKSNLFSTYEVIKLVKHMRNLKAFVYVSSSYSNCHHPVVEEGFYKLNINFKTLLTLAETENLEINDKQILGDVATTYFYIMAAAEQAVKEESKGLPTAIFRPSAIISTWKEPIAGWTDKAFAPTSVVKSLILGYCSSILCTDNLIIDMVPGDFAVNALIAIAWDIHTRYVNNNLVMPRVYNYVSMVDNPLKFKTFLTKIIELIHSQPSELSIWYPTLNLNVSRSMNKVCSLTRPLLLAYFLQWKGRILKTADSRNKFKTCDCEIHEIFMDTLDSMIKNPHVYINNNVKELWDDMNEWDKKLFAFNIKHLNWNMYLPIYYEGILRYVLKEERRNDANAMKRLTKLRMIHSVTVVFSFSVVFFLLYQLFGFFIIK